MTSTTPSAHPWRVPGLGILAVLLLLGCGLSLAFGARSIPLDTVRDTVTHLGETLAHPQDYSQDERVVAELRFPRTLLAILVGAALGMAGALIQGHTRNPLADPGILGVSSGAALAVVLSFSFFGVSSIGWTAVWAFLGAILATIAVFGLAAVGGGQINPITLVVGGAALSAVLTALTSSLILTNEDNLDRMRFWTVGSVAARPLEVFFGVLPIIAIALVAGLAQGPVLNLLGMGDDVAAGLGVNTRRARGVGMLLIALLAGAATAAAGPMSFIGLVVPHLVRVVTGPDFRWILPYSALAGAILLLYADVAGRIIARPAELQVGIVLAFVGAPFFMYLLARKKVSTL
ncbi:iron ABC transporter permease [Corynebacterium sp. 13CS0277]|uniref:FecCD family ABC transporter permease n=1 Tax=Corynebacterium sp. 13CS0277 TaxID=2071994 RepID=UPI000D02B2B2|nr:iron ABC transporter permease [Corynebacterium sp. 13CS0277]PRQ10958.1 iron ABC transporter permease [Corynebacterium sp. 13CS0277]